MRLPLLGNDGWLELKQKNLSIPFLAWVVVLPLSLLPPVLLYFAGVQYGDNFIPGFADKEWRFITTILFLAELLTFFGLADPLRAEQRQYGDRLSRRLLASCHCPDSSLAFFSCVIGAGACNKRGKRPRGAVLVEFADLPGHQVSVPAVR